MTKADAAYEPLRWSSLDRDPKTGGFKSADLANILHSATEASASAFKARGIPEVLRVVEIMGIEQNRRWGVCSLNDFRKFLGLKRGYSNLNLVSFMS